MAVITALLVKAQVVLCSFNSLITAFQSNMSSLSPLFDLLHQSSLSDDQLQQALSLLSPFPPFNSLSLPLQMALVPYLRTHDYAEGQTIACDFDHWTVAIVAKGQAIVVSGTVHRLEKQTSRKRRSKSHISLNGNKPTREVILGPGDDLIVHITSTSTALCLEPVGILVLSKRDFATVLTQKESKSTTEKANFLLSVPAFSMWSQASLSRYLDLFQSRSYSKGEIVYREGDQAAEVYIVKEGEFKFVKRLEGGRKKAVSLQSSPIKMRGSEVQLLLKSSREVFGDMEVLEDLPRAHTCLCVSPSAQVYAVSKSVLPI